MSSQKAADYANALTAARRQAEIFFYQPIRQWLKIQVRLGNLTKNEASQTFNFEEVTTQTIDFKSEDWEETWSYGGHETHYGRCIQIPFGFFDDETPYLKEADDYEYEQEQRREATRARTGLAKIRRLESELAEARKKAGL